MMKRSRILAIAIGAAAIAVSTTAFAGEVKGPPGSDQDTPGTISNGLSFCSYSGLNDTPEGIPGIDPGGQVQSYGYFMAKNPGLFDPSNPDDRAGFNFPGVGCNPQQGGPAR